MSSNSHSSLTGVFKHAAIMLPFAAVTGALMLPALGLEANFANTFSIGLEHMKEMFIDPLLNLPEFFNSFSFCGDLTYQWGMAEGMHHGAVGTSAAGAGGAHTVAAHSSAAHAGAGHVSGAAAAIPAESLSTMLDGYGLNLTAEDMNWLENYPIEDELKAKLARKATLFGEDIQSFIPSWCAENNIAVPAMLNPEF